MQPTPFTKEDTRKKARSQVLDYHSIKKALLDKHNRRCAHCYRKTVPVRLTRVNKKTDQVKESNYCLLCHHCIIKRQEKRKEDKKRLWRKKLSSHKISKAGFFNRIRTKVFERDDHKCLWCDSRKNLGLGPLIPLSRGGKLVFDNYVTTCQHCRPSKGNKLPLEFIAESIFIDEYLHEELDEHLRVRTPAGKYTTIKFYLFCELSEYLNKVTNDPSIPSHTRSRAELLNIKLLSN
ncbi:hypothetical protein ES703_66775 [subsurface metagenome]